MLLTDGCMKWNKAKQTWFVEFSNTDTALHRVFKELGETAFEEKLKTYMFYDKSCNVFISRYVRRTNSKMVKELFKLTPTYTTRLTKNKEPTLNFILKSNKRIKRLAFRLAMSADGFVGISYNKNKNKKFPRMGLACAHPELVKQWSRIIKEIDISMILDKDNSTWSKIHGLRTTRISEIKKFRKIGDFYPIDAKVSRGNFKGLLKNYVLSNIIKNYG